MIQHRLHIIICRVNGNRREPRIRSVLSLIPLSLSMLHSRFASVSLAAIAALAVGATPTALVQPKPSRPPAKSAQSSDTAALSARFASIIETLESQGESANFTTGRDQALALFDHVIATTAIPAASNATAANNPALARYVQAAAYCRVLSQLVKCQPPQRVRGLQMLREHPIAVNALASLIKEEHDKAPSAYELLGKLVDKYPRDIDRLAPLASALCVVHDAPLIQHINENVPKAGDPVEIFDYFVRNENKMVFPLATMPAELLIYVVDVTASPAEMQWALDRYQKNPMIGERYSEIKYDTDHFTKGLPKKCSIAPGGWSMQAIQKFGGVCADQAYYASTVGKAQGVPTAYVVGRSAAIGHAWLGYLRMQGGKSVWDFSSGRYDEYQDVRGNVIDPQTGRIVSDGHVGILSDYLSQKKEVRTQSAALIDAAKRLAVVQSKSMKFPPDIDGFEDDWVIDTKAKPLAADVPSRLRLLEAGLRRAPANVNGWTEIREMAEAGQLSYKDKTEWADVLFLLCGKSYADFSLDVLLPMIETEKDTKDQDRLWNAAFNTYRQRPDLASQVRLRQGEMWENADENGKAWDAYQDVIQKFVNEGPYAVDAAAHIEKLLKANDKAAEVPKMYEAAYRKANRPKKASPEFVRGSNWFRLGLLYARSLGQAGKEPEMMKVLSELGVDPKKLKAPGK